MNKIKYNFFEQIKYAVTSPMQYYRLTKIGGGRLTGFVFLFVLIISLFSLIPDLYNGFGPNGITDYLNHKVPKFELSDGSLWCAERIEEKDSFNYLLLDTNVQEFTSDDINRNYISAAYISKTNMIVYQKGVIQNIEFAKLGKMHFDNSIIKALMPLIYLSIFLFIILAYVFMVGFYFLTALFYSVVGLIVALVTNSQIKYNRIFKSAIYGKVTTSLLSCLFIIIPIPISGFIFTGITILINCTYVVYGTLSHNSEEIVKDNKPDLSQFNY